MSLLETISTNFLMIFFLFLVNQNLKLSEGVTSNLTPEVSAKQLRPT